MSDFIHYYVNDAAKVVIGPRKAVCSKCFTTKHNGHEFLDLECDINKGSVKIEQTEVSKQLQEKVKTYDDRLEMLKFKTSRLDLITNTSKEKVEKKVTEQCEEIKKKGGDFIMKIQELDDRERAKLLKDKDVVQGKKRDLGSYVKLLADSSSLQSLVEVLETLPKAKALLADNCSRDINTPELFFPIFKANEDGLNLTEEQLGQFDTSKMIMFKSSFDFESLQDEKNHFSVDNHDLEKLSLTLRAAKDLHIGLYLNVNKNYISENLKFCTIRYTIKLVSYTDCSKSLLWESISTYKAGEMSWGWRWFIDWNNFVNPENGFIDDNKNFQVEASAICTDLKWKE
ncbi:hypothetical protein LOTGIDRAFT_153738 [Lottia gigantea]|uniref:MATH domain-containing protein n=1 Tax=Lottia gigantea TaxID=225164 RepID=V4A3I9_LOTGI|nr:hypothetical protein LOTGIDRAFT_153738 [Lottia gigantea]ESO91302.1 hypothetical protein LOTGIDRAFT_153738 [Lottia gigantea]